MIRTYPKWLRSSIVQLLIGSALISFSGVFVKIAHVGPTASGFYRLLFGGLGLLVIVWYRREPLWRGWPPFFFAVLAGLIFAADIFAWHRSIQYVGPGLATILGNFQVFFLAAVGILVFREHATRRYLLSVPLAIIGLILLVGLEWPELGAEYKRGVGLGLLTALAYAAFLLTIRGARNRLPRLPSTANLAIVSFVSAAALGASAFAEGASLRIPDFQAWSVLLAYGLVCQASGWVIISNAFPRVRASRAGLILLLQPVLTFIWDILFFGRPTTIVEAVGAMLAVGAVYLGNTARSQPREDGLRPGGEN